MEIRALAVALIVVTSVGIAPVSAQSNSSSDAGGGLLDLDDDGLGLIAELKAGTNPFEADTDGDGLSDGEEVPYPTTSATSRDTDGDGLSDERERNGDSHPNKTDTDGDGVPDPAEIANGTRPDVVDTDGDGLSDYAEITKYDSDPTRTDTDGDDLVDRIEVNSSEYDVDNPDTDGDGTRDYFEWRQQKGDAQSPDETEANESVANGTRSVESNDWDGDGLTNERERELGTDPNDTDTDGDGLSDKTEVDPPSGPDYWPSDPLKKHSDQDRWDDGFERRHNMNPNRNSHNRGKDIDGDGLGAEFERQIGTSVYDKDTDNDGIPDGMEMFRQDDFPNGDPLRPDVYIEVDWEKGVEPNRTAFKKVEEAYADAPVETPVKDGISVHFVFDHEPEPRRDVGELGTVDQGTLTKLKTRHFDKQGLYYRYLVIADDVESNNQYYDNEERAGYENVGAVENGTGAQRIMQEVGRLAGISDDTHPAVLERQLSPSQYPSTMNSNYVLSEDHTELRYDRGRNIHEWEIIHENMNESPASRIRIKAALRESE